MEISLLSLANDIRKKYKRVSYVKGDHVFVQLTASGKGLFFNERSTLPIYLPVPNLNNYAIERLKKFDEYEPNLLEILQGAVSDEKLLILADKVSRLFLIGDCFVENGVLSVNGKSFSGRDEFRYGMPTVFQKNPITLELLASKALSFDYYQEGNAVLLDGAVYVVKHPDFLKNIPHNTDTCTLIGYLKDGAVEWEKIRKDYFKTRNTEQGKVLVIDSIRTLKLKTVFKTRKVSDYLRVKESPYPVAILPSGEYAYYYSEKILGL